MIQGKHRKPFICTPVLTPKKSDHQQNEERFWKILVPVQRHKDTRVDQLISSLGPRIVFPLDPRAKKPLLAVFFLN
jgi:hypothetical protein